jgi:energy-coupling factor transporter ATP-binding protein EcfA2
MDRGPVNSAGGVNQGYLFEISAEAISLLIDQIGDDPALDASEIRKADLPKKSHSGIVSLRGFDQAFIDDLKVAGVRAEDASITRFISAMMSKRFLILTGLAGSGKTKLAQAFARWITPDPGWGDGDSRSRRKRANPHYALVPVGADWTGNENVVGYPNGLDREIYETRPALELIRHALERANRDIPHFLILDEMNLSHVERYFADVLSAIESEEAIPLYEGSTRQAGGREVPRELRLPENLFIIGTVNVDETTYMFSPKVLDRANVIEFRVEEDDVAAFLASPKAIALEALDGKGAAFGRSFVEASADKALDVPASVAEVYQSEMLLFFNLLREHNSEFGYRVAYEAARFIHFYHLLGGYGDTDTDWFNGAMDAVIVQKFLPKLHGSRSKLEGLLWALAWACGAEREERDGKDFPAQLSEAGEARDDAKYSPDVIWSALATKNSSLTEPVKARYPLSFDKVIRMWRKLTRDQFVSFAEA